MVLQFALSHATSYVGRSVHPTTQAFIYLSYWPTFHPSIHSTKWAPVHLSVYPLIRPSVHPFLCPPACLFVCLLVFMSLCPSVCQVLQVMLIRSSLIFLYPSQFVQRLCQSLGWSVKLTNPHDGISSVLPPHIHLRLLNSPVIIDISYWILYLKTTASNFPWPRFFLSKSFLRFSSHGRKFAALETHEKWEVFLGAQKKPLTPSIKPSAPFTKPGNDWWWKG